MVILKRKISFSLDLIITLLNQITIDAVYFPKCYQKIYSFFDILAAVIPFNKINAQQPEQ